MAKGKSTNSAKRQSGSPSPPKQKPLAIDERRPSPSERKPEPGRQPEISPVKIGHVAGDVWSLLSRDGGQTLAAIKKSLDAPADLIMAAIGWLAREDKLDITTSGRTVKISLREL